MHVHVCCKAGSQRSVRGLVINMKDFLCPTCIHLTVGMTKYYSLIELIEYFYSRVTVQPKIFIGNVHLIYLWLVPMAT